MGFLIGFSIVITFLISIDTQLRKGTTQNEEIKELLKELTDNNRWNITQTDQMIA